MNLKKESGLKNNIIFQYTLLSLLMTILVAFALVVIMIGRVQSQLIVSRGEFYREYISAIPENYSEVMPYFREPAGEERHEIFYSRDESAPPEDHNDDWSHFTSDLLQYPYILNVKILNSEGKVIRGFTENSVGMVSNDKTVKKVSSKDDSIIYSIISNNHDLIINYYIPIIFENRQIGTAEIITKDNNLKQRIKTSRIQFVVMIFISGFIFYISLFILFYRVYIKQKNAIARIDKSQMLTIRTMSLLAELKDNDTGEHIQRTSDYCRILAGSLKDDPNYSEYITDDYISDLERSAPLHDIGKVGIPERILLKPGRLTDDEFKIIKKHPELGASVLQKATESLEFRTFFEIGYQIVLHHHENWDGSGYPAGIKGLEIPLSARIMAIADVYDALTTERPYKRAFSHEEAVELILQDKGRKFDPTIVENFMRVEQDFKEISDRST